MQNVRIACADISNHFSFLYAFFRGS